MRKTRIKPAENKTTNVRDIRAAGRIAEGRIYGERRDDRSKQTPMLAHYSGKLVIALGYKIEKE